MRYKGFLKMVNDERTISTVIMRPDTISIPYYIRTLHQVNIIGCH